MADPKTVRIVSSHPETQGDFVILNEDEYDPEVHELYGEASDSDALHVGKGPGGRLYLKRGKERVDGPFATQEEADAALAKASE
jgi:hypothetical protein